MSEVNEYQEKVLSVNHLNSPEYIKACSQLDADPNDAAARAVKNSYEEANRRAIAIEKEIERKKKIAEHKKDMATVITDEKTAKDTVYKGISEVTLYMIGAFLLLSLVICSTKAMDVPLFSSNADLSKIVSAMVSFCFAIPKAPMAAVWLI